MGELTATAVWDNIKIVSEYRMRYEDVRFIEVNCEDFDAYKRLPDALMFGGNVYGRTGWNSDKCLCYYSTAQYVATIPRPAARLYDPSERDVLRAIREQGMPFPNPEDVRAAFLRIVHGPRAGIAFISGHPSYTDPHGYAIVQWDEPDDSSMTPVGVMFMPSPALRD